ncbi:MAG: thioredoxin family protein [Vicinamibacterales bacterium]
MTGILVAACVLLATVTGVAQSRKVPLDLAPLVGSDGTPAGTEARLALGVGLPDGFHVQSNQPKDPNLIPTVLTIEAPPGWSVAEVVFPPAVDLKQEGSPEPLKVLEQHFNIGVRLTTAAGTPPGDVVVPARLRYQACNDKMCFAPTTVPVQWTLHMVAAGAAVTPANADIFGKIAFGSGASSSKPADGSAAPSAVSASDDGVARLEKFETLATTGGYLPSADFLTFIKNAETGVTPSGLFDGRGPLAILLIVLLGGFALNLTPCVLPMIPINLAIIGAGAQAGSRARGFMLGATYGGAMAFVYGVLGLVVILTASTFGTLNASPWFNLGIAVLFVALSLAMFDIIEIDFSKFSGGIGGGAGRGTFMLAFTMGAVAALLAGACVAPVVIQVVLFASDLYAKGTRIALALPFFLGIGMAIPWPIAGAGLASLPKPGPWMVRVKQVFGVLILGTAVYYGYLAYELFANRWVDPSAVASSVDAKVKEGWHSSLAEGLEVAARENKPVLIDMWATWCKNCLTMDVTTFEDPAVKSALTNYVKIKFQAEDPDTMPAQALMARFKAVGLPTYVILKPKS